MLRVGNMNYFNCTVLWVYTFISVFTGSLSMFYSSPTQNKLCPWVFWKILHSEIWLVHMEETDWQFTQSLCRVFPPRSQFLQGYAMNNIQFRLLVVKWALTESLTGLLAHSCSCCGILIPDTCRNIKRELLTPLNPRKWQVLSSE